jgi:lysophospholipase L1-like esterase
LQRLFIDLEESNVAYPRTLQSMLASRYAAQASIIGMPNEGVSGEFVSEGKSRLPGVLSARGPQVLLLQEGANDMNQGRPPVDAIVEDFRSMIRGARTRGIRVFLGTVLPQRANACRGYDFCDGVNDTVATNAKLRAMANVEGATVVDLYAAFDGQTSALLGLDGLHPNEAGYTKMAETFFSAIRQQLEVP